MEDEGVGGRVRRRNRAQAEAAVLARGAARPELADAQHAVAESSEAPVVATAGERAAAGVLLEVEPRSRLDTEGVRGAGRRGASGLAGGGEAVTMGEVGREEGGGGEGGVEREGEGEGGEAGRSGGDGEEGGQRDGVAGGGGADAGEEGGRERGGGVDVEAFWASDGEDGEEEGEGVSERERAGGEERP